MNLQRIQKKIKIRIIGRFQPDIFVVKNPRILIFATVGMGNISNMMNIIKNFDNVTLCIQKKDYIIEFIEKWVGVEYFFINEHTDKQFDVCIMPNQAIRVDEMLRMIKFNIPVRIGQIEKKNAMWEFLFNVVIPLSDLENEEKSFIDLENIIRRII
jgi:hypothetical protein